MRKFTVYFKGVTFCFFVMICGITLGQNELLTKPTKFDSSNSNSIKHVPLSVTKSTSSIGIQPQNIEKGKNTTTYVSPKPIDLNKHSIDPNLITDENLINDEINSLKAEMKKNKADEKTAAMLKKQIISLRKRKKQLRKLAG